MLGFTFNGKHSSEFGLIMKSINRSLLPQRRITEEVVINRHSSYKFENGYSDRIIQIQCSLADRDIGLRRQKLREIAGWLSIEGQLIFDDEPDKYYIGRLDSEIGLTVNTLFDRFTLNFRCKPFAKSTYINEYVILDSDVVLYSDIPVGYDLQNNFYVTNNVNGKIYNFGTYETDMIVEIDGTAKQIIIGTDTETFTINNIAEKTYVDTENMICYTIDIFGKKQNKLQDFEGVFPKLKTGENNIYIKGTALNCNVFFNFRNTYL
ncbi:distal tail protein Dit [Caminicella sporogenes]|uniref:distal tail protein Dit n=1 Tax=Caminicella sporogenes TaxID=166485 RepID=UPI00253FD300|nr:distal tail protein Dit [Caminicella sporogenes]WIF94312.1 phage tail family protein [Caminicella sporogenes]